MPQHEATESQKNAAADTWLGSLTSFRGIAALWVMFHNDVVFMEQASQTWAQQLFQRGYLAVDMFFALSGFLLAFRYRSEFQTMKARRYMHFLLMRIARIYPLYFMLLTFRCLIELAALMGMSYQGAQDGPPFSNANSPTALLANYLMVQAWGPFDHATWIPAYWSVSAEWFAYLLFPLLAAFGYWFCRRWSVKGIAYVVILVCIACLALGCKIFGQLEFPMEYSLLRCLPTFVVGMVLATKFDAAKRAVEQSCLRRTMINALIAMAILGISVGLFTHLPDLLIACLLLTLVFTGPMASGLVARAINARLFVWLGTLSYAIYLSHMPVFRVVKIVEAKLNNPLENLLLGSFLVRLCSVIAVSYCLYHLIELPGRARLRSLVDKSTDDTTPETRETATT